MLSANMVGVIMFPDHFSTLSPSLTFRLLHAVHLSVRNFHSVVDGEDHTPVATGFHASQRHFARRFLN